MMEAVDDQIKMEKDISFRMLLVSIYDSLEGIALKWDEESAREFAGDDLLPSWRRVPLAARVPDEPLAEWEKELLGLE